MGKDREVLMRTSERTLEVPMGYRGVVRDYVTHDLHGRLERDESSKVPGDKRPALYHIHDAHITIYPIDENHNTFQVESDDTDVVRNIQARVLEEMNRKPTSKS